MEEQRSTRNGRTALVTGASRGIGRSIAHRLARDGFTVAVHYNSGAAAAQETLSLIEADGGDAFLLQGDISHIEEIPSLMERFDTEVGKRGLNGIDVLVNNAGIKVEGTIDKFTEAQFDRQIDTNLKGGFFVIQNALPRMSAGGRIINISSSSTRKAMPHIILYSATKFAIDFMTKALAVQLGPLGITVNSLKPGFTETDMTQQTPPELRDYIKSQIALQRIGQPDDISPSVSFLASQDSAWVTGQVFSACGGEFL